MRHSLYLLFAVAIQSLSCADVTQLPIEDRRMLQDLSRFHEVHSTHDLPSAIVKLCAEDGHIADPGQNWNATEITPHLSMQCEAGSWMTGQITRIDRTLSRFA